MLYRIITSFLIMYTAYSLYGCLFIPIPTPTHDYGQPIISEDVFKSFEQGKTTRADILLLLGYPEERLQDDRHIVYHWRRGEGYACVFLIPASGNCGPMNLDHYLALEFGPDNRLKRFIYLKPGITDSFINRRKFINKWINESDSIPK